MASKLLIVESPAKARTLGKFLGSDFQVKASVGHVRDLPKNKLGLDEDAGWEPQYEVLPTKEKVVTELTRAAKKADEIYVGTDPDREGEAICWHLQEILKAAGRPMHRVLFHEITKKAVQGALDQAHDVDMDRVNAQQARRVIDRLVGYRLSPLLWDKVKRGLSAGRVQSVALKMVCDRESEIDAFEPEEYWLVDTKVEGPAPPPFTLRLAKKDGKRWRPGSKAEADAVTAAVRKGPLTIGEVTRKKSRQKPKAPFITSHLQQEASRRLRMPVRRTMQVAQSLYEGVDLGDAGTVGLITYMRTDSLRVSDDAVAAVREVIAAEYGDDTLPKKPNQYKNKSAAQDAHEAIRPTDVTLTPDKAAPYLKNQDQKRLYTLIWERFVASQMKPATFDVTQVDVTVSGYTLSVSGRVLKDPGFLRVWQESSDGSDKVELPQGLEAGQELKLLQIEAEQKFTQPPPRYNEASLVKALEENGIGRPSTYASILGTLSSKDYAVRDKGVFRPTELGKVVTRLLTESFSHLINETYTARLEEQLDRIAEGDEEWREAVKSFAEDFAEDMAKAREEMEQVKGVGVPLDEKCPECGEGLVIKFGRFGEFVACSGYPDCKYTRDVETPEAAEAKEAAEGDVPACPECEAEMVQKRSRFGPFWACTRYPDCKGTRRIGGAAAKPEPTGVDCPEEGCDGEIVQRTSRRGRTFYGCSAFPKCRFTMWDAPQPGTECPECGTPIMGLKETKRRGRELVCRNRDGGCKHREPAPDAGAEAGGG